jgi:hypothetical protein
MSGVGTAHSTTLALLFGRDDIPFEHTWEGAGGATRFYPGFAAMSNEEANSRIYGEIHYRFDNEAGQSAGRNVANYVFQNFMRPRDCVREAEKFSSVLRTKAIKRLTFSISSRQRLKERNFTLFFCGHSLPVGSFFRWRGRVRSISRIGTSISLTIYLKYRQSTDILIE